jgi:hypothetical protein
METFKIKTIELSKDVLLSALDSHNKNFIVSLVDKLEFLEPILS